ncbi:AAA family ATPase [uncultured Xanthomonas sp.]|uniref:AAA family ATPase n=1 Tax=uncultured Xanthomonas sp. TaxID=152831 RepID=UPI0025CD1843|nr:AAA family ATPase [uncultured Xanthomonas sp.]
MRYKNLEKTLKIKQISIKDFKRFANLEISEIPKTAKLILLTGPNGSGKTSLFEAFNYWMKSARNDYSYDSDYYLRHESIMTPSMPTLNHSPLEETLNKIKPIFYDEPKEIKNNKEIFRKAFYIRSAYRHSPDFTINGLNKLEDILDDPGRATTLMLSESRVQNNYQRLVGRSLELLYDPEGKNITAGQITEQLIGEIRDAMLKVFDDLVLEGPGNPLDSGTFRFTKGITSNFHYKNLSGGEKAAFDLLLDFIVKRKYFNDTIFCIDEPELHMHTRLQAKLLAVMFELTPDNCQLWLSTHSIGMARKAAELNAENPGLVAFIDFHEKDFDKAIDLKPIQPDKRFWKQMFNTALDDLAKLVVPDYVVFCEGRRIGQSGKKPSFDVTVYNIIFGPWYPGVEFIPLGGGNEVRNDGETFEYLLTKLAPGIRAWKVLDGDDRNEDEINELKSEGVYVLPRRDVESFLWDDSVLKKFCESLNNPDAFGEILQTKQLQLYNLPLREKPNDDVKEIIDVLYVQIRRSLKLVGYGNSAEAFSIKHLAPLIKPGMPVYEELAASVLAPLM